MYSCHLLHWQRKDNERVGCHLKVCFILWRSRMRREVSSHLLCLGSLAQIKLICRDQIRRQRFTFAQLQQRNFSRAKEESFYLYYYYCCEVILNWWLLHSLLWRICYILIVPFVLLIFHDHCTIKEGIRLEGSDIFISNYQQKVVLCINLLSHIVIKWLLKWILNSLFLIFEESSGAGIFVFVTWATVEQFIKWLLVLVCITSRVADASMGKTKEKLWVFAQMAGCY